jgi:outer membrane protein OmpA-like peptidoglycan-associated protein
MVASAQQLRRGAAMNHPVVHDQPMLGARGILSLLLKIAGVGLLLTAALAFPVLSQQLPTVYPVQMPRLTESNPVTILQLEADRAKRASLSYQALLGGLGAQRLAGARVAGLRSIEMHDRMGMAIHFDVGSAAIRPDAIAALEGKLDLLRGVPALRIRIEGQADVRGSSASNTTLAWTRAEAAKHWLTARGIASDRIDAVGFSSWRPICEDRQESCLWQNRRAEFVIVAGADTDVPRTQ